MHPIHNHYHLIFNSYILINDILTFIKHKLEAVALLLGTSLIIISSYILHYITEIITKIR